MKKAIFTTLAIGLIGLIGFSFSQNGQQSKQVNAVAQTINKKGKAVVPSSAEPLSNDKVYYFVAKNYAQEGNGVFYQDTITIGNSAIVSSGTRTIRADFDIVDNNVKIYSSLYFEMALNSGVYKLNLVYLMVSNQSEQATIYYADGGYFRRQYCAFTCTNFSRVTGDNAYAVLTQFFNIYDMSDYAQTYEFDTAFNFNNLYQLESFYAQAYNPVVGASTSTSDWTKTYNIGRFYTNGLVFDSIKATFRHNNNYKFETTPDSQDYKSYDTGVVGATNYYFLQMEYVNSVTNFSVIACNRVSFQQDNQVYIRFMPAWSNQAYKYINIENSVTSLFTQSVLNSLSDTNQLSDVVYTTDIGLGSAFNLLGLAFSSWLPILSVSVIPGITIGTLIFLPLIAGIIILIIWIVKR